MWILSDFIHRFFCTFINDFGEVSTRWSWGKSSPGFHSYWSNKNVQDKFWLYKAQEDQIFICISFVISMGVGLGLGKLRGSPGLCRNKIPGKCYFPRLIPAGLHVYRHSLWSELGKWGCSLTMLEIGTDWYKLLHENLRTLTVGSIWDKAHTHTLTRNNTNINKKASAVLYYLGRLNSAGLSA